MSRRNLAVLANEFGFLEQGFFYVFGKMSFKVCKNYELFGIKNIQISFTYLFNKFNSPF